jgi:hypothetical protein
LDQLTTKQIFLLQLIIACNDRRLELRPNALAQVMNRLTTSEHMSSSQVLAAITFLRQARCLEANHDKPLTATTIGREAVASLPIPKSLSQVVDELIRVQGVHDRLTQRGANK